jgi:hypothetical protein
VLLGRTRLDDPEPAWAAGCTDLVELRQRTLVTSRPGLVGCQRRTTRKARLSRRYTSMGSPRAPWEVSRLPWAIWAKLLAWRRSSVPHSACVGALSPARGTGPGHARRTVGAGLCCRAAGVGGRRPHAVRVAPRAGGRGARHTQRTGNWRRLGDALRQLLCSQAAGSTLQVGVPLYRSILVVRWRGPRSVPALSMAVGAARRGGPATWTWLSHHTFCIRVSSRDRPCASSPRPTQRWQKTPWP